MSARGDDIRDRTVLPSPPATQGDRPSYRITVRGRLTDRFACAFEGMHLEADWNETTLVGRITDQSHLFGILDRIHCLGLDLISVKPGERQA